MRPRFRFRFCLLLAVVVACSGGDGPKVGKFIRARAPAAGVAPMAADVSCVNGADVSCTNAAAAAACTVTTGCDADHHCIFARSPDPGCPCYAGEVRWCGGGSKVQFCAATGPDNKATAWQPTCGPTAVTCHTGIPDCDAGTRQTRFDLDKESWEEDTAAACVPTARCPTLGETVTCTPDDQRCKFGQRTYGASGWGPCVGTCPVCVPSGEVCDGRDNDCNGAIDDHLTATACRAPAAGVCAAGQTSCVDGRLTCVAGAPRPEVCDGVDDDCDGLADPVGTCGEVVVRQQSDSDNGREMTWSPGLPTDLIDGYRIHGGPCGEDDHGRTYYRTRAEVSAASPNGATCTLAGPYGGYVSPDKTDCRIRVHYKTVRMGSNVWCSGTWWAAPQGAYRR